jgi:hypothetical protein
MLCADFDISENEKYIFKRIDNFGKLIAEEEYFFEGINNINVPEVSWSELTINIIRTSDNKQCGKVVLLLGKNKTLYIDYIRRYKSCDNPGFGKFVLNLLTCIADKKGFNKIEFDAYSSINTNRKNNKNAQNKLEAYYNNIGFQKKGPRTEEGGQPYSTKITNLIKNHTGGKRKTARIRRKNAKNPITRRNRVR